MAASEPRIVPIAIDPAGFIAALADPVQRDDAAMLALMMARLSGEPARMWGPSIIG